MVYTNHFAHLSKVQIFSLLLISFYNCHFMLWIALVWLVTCVSVQVSEPKHVRKVHMQNVLTCLTICWCAFTRMQKGYWVPWAGSGCLISVIILCIDWALITAFPSPPYPSFPLILLVWQVCLSCVTWARDHGWVAQTCQPGRGVSIYWLLANDWSSWVNLRHPTSSLQLIC